MILINSLYALVRKAFAYTTFYFPRLSHMFFECLNYGILKKKIKYDIYKHNEKKSDIFAIFSIFPNLKSVTNIRKVNSELIKLNISVILVVNSNSVAEKFITAISDMPITILVRPNIGRDFGGYKTGIEYLNLQGLKNINKLILLNDSCIYPGNLAKFFVQVHTSKTEWGCAYLNYEHNLHAQSFFTWYSGVILNNPGFTKFWNGYKPYSNRVHAIKKGEVGLTRALLKMGYFPQPLLSSARLDKVITSSKFKYEADFFISAWHMYGIQLDDLLYLEDETHRIQFQRCLVETNPSHRLGILGTQYLGLPLKRDLFKSGFATLGSITKCLRTTGMSEEEIIEIEASLVTNGSNNTGTKIEKIQRSYGLY